jgi:hypothetical protein
MINVTWVPLDHIDHRWTTSIEVYLYLIFNPKDRRSLLHEAHRLTSSQPIRLWHLYTNRIIIPPNQADEYLVSNLITLLHKQGIYVQPHIAMYYDMNKTYDKISKKPTNPHPPEKIPIWSDQGRSVKKFPAGVAHRMDSMQFFMIFP